MGLKAKAFQSCLRAKASTHSPLSLKSLCLKHGFSHSPVPHCDAFICTFWSAVWIIADTCGMPACIWSHWADHRDLLLLQDKFRRKSGYYYSCQYDYIVVTNRGITQDGTFRISVTAKYSKPTMSSLQNEIEDGGPAHFYCNVSGGYPAGAIHWFDSTKTNWTKSATLEVKEGEDKLLHLSSKLTFAKIDSSWAPFRCVVLNSKFVQEGEETFQPTIKGGNSDTFSGSDSEFKMETKYVAPIVVIGSLIVGLLLVLLLRGRCSRQARRPSTLPILSDFRDVESGTAEDVTRALTEKKLTEEATERKR
ncbi:hypothetical protein AOLI_G00004380 [Acnodon oligacanthus]